MSIILIWFMACVGAMMAAGGFAVGAVLTVAFVVSKGPRG